jgi:2-methylisocitrate lyase-like PEP mutase family enzyme
VNVLAIPRAPAIPELAELGVSRVSYGSLLHRQAMEQFESALADLLSSRS